MNAPPFIINPAITRRSESKRTNSNLANWEQNAVTEVPMVSHILETSLYVSDLVATKNFYQRIFGFPCLLEDHRMCALQTPSSGVLLLFKHDASLHPSHVPGGVIPAHGGSGVLHLCFAIPVAALTAWTNHLEAQGVALESRVRQAFGGISLYFRDPDGHSVEVATPGLWANY
jgi:catechol 2,3-dioxygenase-like lactoylglutathione lyase family enzyme